MLDARKGGSSITERGGKGTCRPGVWSSGWAMAETIPRKEKKGDRFRCRRVEASPVKNGSEKRGGKSLKIAKSKVRGGIRPKKNGLPMISFVGRRNSGQCRLLNSGVAGV